MSSDEKHRIDEDEIDLGSIFKVIWNYKFFLLALFIISIPISVTFTTYLVPKYKAETVFEKPMTQSSRESSFTNARGMGSSGVMSLLGVVGNSKDNFYSVIRSHSFLKTVFLNNTKLDKQTFEELCAPSTGPPRLISLRSLLILMGLSENKIPSESQITSLKVRCLNDLFKAENDAFNNVETNAYKVSVITKDPVFSANLANQIVEKYFDWYEQRMDMNFQNLKKYLSKVISETQSELVQANKLMQDFNMKHTLLMDTIEVPGSISDSTTGLLIPQSPFKSPLSREIANLALLEKSRSQIKQAILELSNLKEAGRDEIKRFTSSTQLQEVLSRNFVTAFSGINSLSAASRVNDRDVKKVVSIELRSLQGQFNVLVNKIGQGKEKTRKLMEIENKFQELAVDVQKKQLIFESLKDQLKEEILASGLEKVEKPVLLTKAVAPFNRDSPNKKLIVLLGAVLFVFAGIVYIFIVQLFKKKIGSLSQLQQLNRFVSCYQIKFKQLRWVIERPNETVISQSFFSRTKEIGKLGCIIDLSKKTRNNTLASTFSRAIANLLAIDNVKVLCLDSAPNNNPFSKNSKQNFTTNSENLDLQGIVRIEDNNGMFAAGEVEKLKRKYSEYDRIICSLGCEVGDLTKFYFIEQCDFYILIGRSFQFDEYNCKKFSVSVREKGNKCLGFFLIN